MIDFILDLFEDALGFIHEGGLVMWPLVVLTVALWFGLSYRMVMLKRGSKLNLRKLIGLYTDNPEAETSGFIDRAAKTGVRISRLYGRRVADILDDEMYELSEGMRRYRALVRTITVIAPLAGLLGTVSGMIEMFDSLGSQTFYGQSGGIANGISQALFTTQFGLVIAVPGLLLGRFLDSREDSMRDEIEQIKEYFTAAEQEGEAI